MSLLIPGGKVIIFNFPAGAAGKMLQNCTALSRHCVIKFPEYAEWQLSQTKFNRSFYQQKLDWILETVPPKLEYHGWLKYELRDDTMYGLSFPEFASLSPMSNDIAKKIADAGLWTTITAHNYDSSSYFNHYWPTVRHVSLINATNFAKKFLPIKNPMIEFDHDWETLGRTDPNICYNFDIDATIHNTDLFCKKVEEMYNYLEFDDFSSNLVAQFHRAYIKIHQ